MSIKDKPIYKKIRQVGYFCVINPYIQVTKKLRTAGITHKYDYLKKYKNCCEGKRCFIIATGPSLREEDVKKLDNEITIGMNSLVKWYDRIGFETTYYVISDYDVYDRLKDDVKAKISKDHLFLAEWVKKHWKLKEDYLYFPEDMRNRFVYTNDKKRCSNDFIAGSYDGESVVFHAVQLAFFLGVKEIYLLGADSNYTPTAARAMDNNAPVDLSLGEKIIEDYKVIKKFADSKCVKIYNATRGGMLEVFQRVDFDTLSFN